MEGASYIPWTIRFHYLIHAFHHSSNDAAECNSLDLNVYIRGITEIEAEARKCYFEGVGSISTDEFVVMMIRDGCFILELFLRFCSWKPFESEDLIQRKLWASSALYKDLLLLENQIPFVVLTKLFTTSLTENLRKGSEEILINLSLQFFNKVMRRPYDAEKWHPYENGKKLPLHLLDLIRSSFTTPFQKLPMDNIPCFLRLLCVGNGWVNPGNRCTSIPCVSKLFRATIEVKPSHTESLLVVKFKKGAFHMPNITIDDIVSSFLVNCVAFEQSQPDIPKYFMRYTAFLDFLLNTKEDVDLLYERKVIEHSFETDEKLATYINALGKDLLFGFDNSYVSQQEDFDNLSKMFNEINAHYRSGIRWKWADFKREYCNKPWLLISAFVALVYLLLTFGQTFIAIYAYVHPKK
ncbi:hypothetical protein CJ030_MR0G002914 [Morella rubra]|uniref:Uncharacterized protein n=1 Tax=Morella rubra TaxID=262757 RepID=A0A6A1UPA0_9ROSI|nr:hypothetical protein CJ030_MR0G002914 [Morella rubra]